MATRYSITYVDGTEAVVNRRPVHLMRAERLITDATGMQEQVLLTLWAAATGGTGTPAEFEAWADTVDDWDKAEVELVPPAQGSGTSPD